jgi:hypothetical protein
MASLSSRYAMLCPHMVPYTSALHRAKKQYTVRRNVVNKILQNVNHWLGRMWNYGVLFFVCYTSIPSCMRGHCTPSCHSHHRSSLNTMLHWTDMAWVSGSVVKCSIIYSSFLLVRTCYIGELYAYLIIWCVQMQTCLLMYRYAFLNGVWYALASVS